MATIILLALSNVFMTFAWYGHLKFLHGKPLWITILISWGIAFFEFLRTTARVGLEMRVVR